MSKLDEILRQLDQDYDDSNHIAGLRKAKTEIVALIRETQRKARIKERKQMSQAFEELSDWAYVNYPDHELEKAIKDFWRKNNEHLEALNCRMGKTDEQK